MRHFSLSEILVREIQPLHKAELRLPHPAHSELELSLFALLSVMPATELGPPVLPGFSGTFLAVFEVSWWKHPNCCSCFCFSVCFCVSYTYIFVTVFEKESNLCWFKGRKGWKSFPRTGGSLWRKLNFCSMFTWNLEHAFRGKNRGNLS